MKLEIKNMKEIKMKRYKKSRKPISNKVFCNSSINILVFGFSWTWLSMWTWAFSAWRRLITSRRRTARRRAGRWTGTSTWRCFVVSWRRRFITITWTSFITVIIAIETVSVVIITIIYTGYNGFFFYNSCCLLFPALFCHLRKLFLNRL